MPGRKLESWEIAEKFIDLKLKQAGAEENSDCALDFRVRAKFAGVDAVQDPREDLSKKANPMIT